MVKLQTPGCPRINYGKATANHLPEILAAYLDSSLLQESVTVG